MEIGGKLQQIGSIKTTVHSSELWDNLGLMISQLCNSKNLQDSVTWLLLKNLLWELSRIVNMICSVDVEQMRFQISQPS